MGLEPECDLILLPMAAYLMLVLIACNMACTFTQAKFEKDPHTGTSSNRLQSYSTFKEDGATYQGAH